MNKIVCLLLCVSLGCSPSAESPSSVAKVNSDNKERPRIALVMKSLANEFFSTMAEAAKNHQASHASEYELVVNGIKDERDIGRQAAIVEEMVASGVQAIVIAPADSKALISVLHRAKKAGVVVVNIDNQLDAKILEEQKIAIPFVGPNNQTGAKKVGDYLATKLKANDAVVILEGLRSSSNAVSRREGFEEAMRAANLKIVDSQSAEWEMSLASNIAASMLREHPETKAILAANDSMALGAMAAAKNSGLASDLLIVGFDNISAVQQAIRDGKILATADQHGDQLAIYGIETALKLLKDPSQKIENVETPVDLITAETLAR